MESIVELRLLGGRIALDFANTVEPRFGPAPRDFLLSAHDLIAWGRYRGALSKREASLGLRQIRDNPQLARRGLIRAVRLREAIFRVFGHVARGSTRARSDLELLRTEYVEGLRWTALKLDNGRFEWTRAHPGAIDGLLWSIARDAVGLLTSPLLGRVRVCTGLQDCGWLFLDETKNRSRRWCSMEGCGNKAKARRLTERRRAGRQPERR